eukprot:Sspe_Gene.81381::Locus_52123_Transcript_1_1_Confidence_1.000_Length_958::g.81381::m.81381
MGRGRAAFFSLDVECLATGPGHSDRYPCWVAVVDSKRRVLVDVKVKPPVTPTSYLTPLTQCTPENLRDGLPLAEVADMVRKRLPENAKLVGQGIDNDLRWLGMDDHGYHLVDLAEHFSLCVKGETRKYSLAHAVKALLKKDVTVGHSAVQDALYSVELYSKHPTGHVRELGRTPAPPSFAKEHDYVYEGVCLAAYYPAKCTCGQPTLRSPRGTRSEALAKKDSHYKTKMCKNGDRCSNQGTRVVQLRAQQDRAEAAGQATEEVERGLRIAGGVGHLPHGGGRSRNERRMASGLSTTPSLLF